MALFLQLIMHEGPLPDDFAERPAPDPAAFGLPTEDDGRRDDPLLGLNANVTQYRPDLAALQSTRSPSSSPAITADSSPRTTR